MNYMIETHHDGVIKWKYFPRYWPFVRGIHRSPVNSPHKGQWNGALSFSLNCVWINSWANNRETGDLRSHHAHYDVIVMVQYVLLYLQKIQKCNHHFDQHCIYAFHAIAAWDLHGLNTNLILSIPQELLTQLICISFRIHVQCMYLT